jgi:hypothetical protein
MRGYTWFSIEQSGDEIIFTEITDGVTVEPNNTVYSFYKDYSKSATPKIVEVILLCAGVASEQTSVILNEDRELTRVQLYGHTEEELKNWKKGITKTIRKHQIPIPKRQMTS